MLSRLGLALAAVPSAIVFALVCALMLLEVDPILDMTAKWSLKRFNPLVGASMQVDRVSGGLLSGIVATRFEITTDDGKRMVTADGVAGKIRLPSLLSRHIALRDVRINRPNVNMTQRPDSSWDLISAFPTDTASTTTTYVTIRDLRLTRGMATVRFLSQSGDSVLAAHEVRAGLRLFTNRHPTTLDLDSLVAAFTPPGVKDTVHVRGGVTLADRELDLRNLTLKSSRSDVVGHGTARLSNKDLRFETLDLNVTAEPLAFADIVAFVPQLNPLAVVRLSLRASGTDSLIESRLNVALGDGSSVDISASGTPRTKSEVSYAANAIIKNVDPRYLLGAYSEAAAKLTGSVAVDVSGPAIDSLSGTATVEVESFTYSRYVVGATKLAARVSQGNMSLDGATVINNARANISATGRFLDEVPTYDAQVRLTAVDLAQFASSSRTTNLNGTLAINGAGLPRQASGMAALTLSRSRWGDVPISDARLVTDFKNRVVGFDAAGGVAAGRVTAAGTVHLDGTDVFVIRRAAAEQLDVAALSGDTLTSRISMQISGRGRGFDPEKMTLRLTATADKSVYGPYELGTGTAQFNLSNGLLQFDADVDLRGGRIRAQGMTRPFTEHTSLAIKTADFSDVNLADLGGSKDWVTSLNGRLSGNLLLADGATSGSVVAHLDTSRVNNQSITHAEVRSKLSRGDLELSFNASTPLGRVAADATGRPFDERPRYEFLNGVFENLNLGAILDRDNLVTRLNGSFGGSVDGTEMSSLRADALISLQPSSLNGQEIRDGNISLRADSGHYIFSTDVQFADGSLNLEGDAHLGRNEDFSVRGAFVNVNLADLAGADSLTSRFSADFEAVGSGLKEVPTTGRVRITGRNSHLEDIRVNSLAAMISIDGRLLTVDSLFVASNVADIDGRGLVALTDEADAPSSDLTIRASLKDLRPTHRFLPPGTRPLADGSITLVVSGDPKDVRFRSDAKLSRIVHNDMRIGEINVRVVGALDEKRHVASAEGRVEVIQASLPTMTAREIRLEAAYRDRSVAYDGRATLDDMRDLRLTGSVSFKEETPVLTMSTLHVRLDRERWQLLQPSTISFGDEYRIQNFSLFSETQQIAVDGYIDLDGSQSLIMTIEEFRIGSVADLFDYKGLDGRLNGYIDLSGPASAPIIAGSLDASLRYRARPIGDMSLNLDYTELRLNLAGRIRNEDGSELTLNGYLPIDLRLASAASDSTVQRGGLQTATAEGESSLRLRTEGFAIDWILPFLDRSLFSHIGGKLTGQVDVRGTFAEPDLQGSAVLTNGSLGTTKFKVVYRDITASFRFSGNTIFVDQFTAKSGRGTATAQGTVNLNELTLGDFDLDIGSVDFLAVDNREYRASADSQLKMTGTTRRPLITGSVQVTAADVFLTEEIADFEPVQLSLEDLQTVEQRFGIRITESDTTTFDFYNALSMTLKVQLSRNTWLRSKKNPTMDIQFTGDLDVQKNRRENAQVFGTIAVIPDRSRIVQFGRTFQITRGTLTYNGPIEEPILDIEAEYAIRAWRNPDNEVTITLTTSGRPDNLDVKLSSDPTMELTDILSYIAFGRPAAESLHLGGTGTGGSLATDIAIGQVAGLIESIAGTGLGLDVIEIEQQGLDARLTAGKYVHRRVYVSISQPLNLGSSNATSSTVQDPREITAEFELLQSLLLRLLTRRGSISVNLLWQYAY